MLHTQVQIENPRRLPLPAQVEAILERAFPTCQRVVVEAELGSGFSGSRVFLVHPIKQVPELPAVVKIAPAYLVEREYQVYQEHIRNKLSGAAEIRGGPVLLPDSDQAGLCYHLVGSGVFEIESLNSFCRHASVREVWHVLEKRLFKRIAPLWRFNYTSAQFSFQASYDHLLPVNLLIEPTSPPTDVPSRVLKVLEPGALTDAPLEPGDYVRVRGFVVTEVDVDGAAVTLNLPPPSDGLPASYRLRVRPVDSPAAYRINQVVDAITGVVTATRTDLLRSYACQALGCSPEAVMARTLTPPGSPAITLPNPLVAVPDILSEPHHVRIATVHGDLNMENVLVALDTRDVRLIDFAMARQDHVLHDLLRLETGVATWLLPQALAEAHLPAETIHRLYEQLHQTVHQPGRFPSFDQLHPALRKVFVMLATIRKTAREYLVAPDDWGEYYRGLTLYLSGALKFKNLDEVPQAPVPKRVAFWGAASAQQLLHAPPSREDKGWQPLIAIVDDLTGQTVDQYEIGELVGRGSMSVVYRARQPRLQRDVAVKVMAPALAADPVFRQRFEREAQSIANLRHPNVLTVHDYGETGDGQLYLVVDYVGGGTLRERMASPPVSSGSPGGGMSLEEGVQIVIQMAEALDYAHRRGVIHRDVKPNNILITAEGRPLLADFGLVKSIQDDRRLTDSGVMVGTPDYVAPEQAQGAKVDGRADIYALGVVLFEILTGQHPYAGETPIGVIIKHVSEPMPAPSDVNPAIPPALDQIVAKATAKEVAGRYQRAGDLARDLRAVLASGALSRREGEPGKLTPLATARAAIELPPFIAGPPILHPRQFFGRERELKRLFNLWKRPPLQNAAVIGPRRSGKTSLLMYLKTVTTTPPAHLRPGQRSDWLPQPERYRWVFVDFQDARTRNRKALLGLMLAGLGLTPTASGPGSEPPLCDLDRFMDVVSCELRRPAVILMDEIDVALARCPELDTGFWESLRSLATNYARGNLGFVLAAQESPAVLARHGDVGSPFFNIFGYTATLGPLTEAEARRLVASSPIPFPPADVAWILTQSGRWPVLLQILCRERLFALEEGETGDAWRDEGLRQIAPFSHLLDSESE